MSTPNYRTIIAYKGTENNLNMLYFDLLKAEQTIKEGKAGWIGKLLRMQHSDLADHVPQNYKLEDVWLDKNNHFPCLKILLFDGHVPMLWVFDKYAGLYDLEYTYLAEDYTNGNFVNSDLEGTIFNSRCFFTLEPCRFTTADGANNLELEEKLKMLCRSPFHTSYQCLFSELQSVGASLESIDDMYRFLDILKKRYPEETFHFRAYAEKF